MNHCSASHVDLSGINIFLLLVIVLWFKQRINVNLEPIHNLWDQNGEILIELAYRLQLGGSKAMLFNHSHNDVQYCQF